MDAKGKKRRKSNSPSSNVPETPEVDLKLPDKPKKPRVTGKGKAEEQDRACWPEYFVELYKIFKALNTVLAFCSSRKHLAITFPVVRKSVEASLKKPLELEKVAELKALLPDLIRFAYIPHDELRINAEAQGPSAREKKDRGRSPDFSAFTIGSSLADFSQGTPHEDEHVLVLDFAAAKGSAKMPNAPSFAYQLPPAMTPDAVKKLIEKRNKRFECAVNELLEAVADSDDPALLIQNSARAHIPVDPNTKRDGISDDENAQSHSIPDSTTRKSINEILEEITTSEWYRDQIVDRRIFEAKDGRIGTLEIPISRTIVQALRSSRNIMSFYTHQARAIDAIRCGRNVIVSTSTASGKSVIYQVPMLRFLEEDHGSKAFYIYPTKALAQDQRVALEQLLWACEGLEHVKVSNYDGDTPMEQRIGIRESASVIFTNFDMLHASILPHEENWRQFFKNLKLIAVDELHYYSGVFGTHAAYIMRRLRRICAAVGNRQIRFISCSATISNPLQHMKNIFGIDDVEVITDDGAPSGTKEFVIWNPPPNDAMDPTLGRCSSLVEATSLMRFLMNKGVRTILFCKYRKMCELAMKKLRQDLSVEGRHDILTRVKAYRGGYSQQDRRRIEQEAFSGNLLGIVATNALELGVDIGVLDAVVMLGYPFGIANLRQQAGRAGRRARDSLAVLVADSLPLDQYYVQYPDELHNNKGDDLLIDLDSRVILEAHLQCAAFEMPLTEEDSTYFGPRLRRICDSCLSKDKEGWYHPNTKFLPYPSKHVSIRGIQDQMYTIMDVTDVGRGGKGAKVLEEIELYRAMFEAFEGAVFMHQGLTFIVQEISHDTRTAKIIRADVNWTTKSRDFTDVDALQTHRIREIKGSIQRAYYGRVELKTIVFGYFKVRNNVILDTVDLEMPPFERHTTGFWIDLPKSTLDILRLKGINAAEAIHSAAHAVLNRFPLAADVRTECKVPVKEYLAAGSKRKRPARLIFFDSAGTDGAIAAKAFDHVSDLMHDAFETVESCSCEDGCDKCIRSAYCKEQNLVQSKIGAQIVIRGILDLPINVDAIPEGESGGSDSIVEAAPVRAVDGVEIEYYAD